ncbi:MAG: hypothetical protein BIFFINMI_03283 [Phycisphaerae bacterium]|nr:hypothetical protein [Phycisphaerae bacterium]
MARPRLVVYKVTPQVSLQLHVFDPATASRPSPGILFVVCGGWRGFNPAKFYPQCAYLAQRGMVAMTVEVRVLERHVDSPAFCTTDARSALRWVRTHADELGIDPQRIAAAGGSAGAQVASATTLIEGFDEPGENLAVSCAADALVLFNPALDLTASTRRIGLFGGHGPARALSPMEHVRPGLPPALLMHGVDDKVVSVDESRRFREAMTRLGNRCDLIEYPGQGHGFFNYFDGKNRMFTSTLEAVDGFLASLGWLTGPPAVAAYAYAGPPPQCE